MGGRVLTGVSELDSLLGGGFPKGSLILVAGNPGTGKTVFSARFLYSGAAEYGESGIYVSFSESRETFLENMSGFGFNFEKMEKEGKFKYIDMTAVKEAGISSILNVILETIHKMKAKRLVIDSFSAMVQAFEKPIDARIVIHLVLSKMVRMAQCTTMLVVEVPVGSERIGLAIEEFVADGVLIFRRDRIKGRLLRRIEILKMRGARITQYSRLFTIEGGFNVLPCFTSRTVKAPRKFKPSKDTPTHFSSGIKELDEILGGGFPRGSIILLEVEDNVPRGGVSSILNPIRLNFVNNGNGVFCVPSAGLSGEYVKESLKPFAEKSLFDKNLQIAEFGEAPQKPNLIPLRGRSAIDDYEKFWEQVSTFKAKTGKPVLMTIGYDTLEYRYPRDSSTLIQLMVEMAKKIRANGDLKINIIRPFLKITPHARYISDLHFNLVEVDGSLCLYGVKPRTCVYSVEVDVSSGFPQTKLRPII